MYDDEYEFIYDDEDSRNYEEFDDTEEVMEERIEEIRGTIKSGTCPECGGKNTMKYKGNICFICSKCKLAWAEDIYYKWILGYPIIFDDGKVY
jgi:hypothetical protein